MGRKTLTGSEMYAHCRNRHEQKHLREKLENLSEEEFVSMDSLKMETNKWRQFRRENLKNSGCSAEATKQGKKGSELISLNSAPHTYPKARLYKDHLQLPWVYTYNTDSHNQICKDLLQSSINYKRSLRLRHQSVKTARLSKISTSSSLESSGNDSPRTSMHEERKVVRQLPRVKNAWVYSVDERRTGDRCPPNTPKAPIFANSSSSTDSEFYENRDIVFVTELKGPEKLMAKSISTKIYNQSTKLACGQQSPRENATNSVVKQTGGIDSYPQLRKEVRNMDFLCAECDGKLTNNEATRSHFCDPLDGQKRFKSTDTNLIESNQPSHENSELTRKGKTRLCRGDSETSLMHYSTSTLTTDTIKSHFGRSTNLSFIFPPTTVDGWRYNSIHEDPEDILATSLYLWDLPPYNSSEESKSDTKSSPSTSRIHQRELPTPIESIVSDRNSKDTSLKLQSLDSVDNSKAVLLHRRRQARDETVNCIDLAAIEKYENREAIISAHEDSTERDKIDLNKFQSQALDGSHTKLSDFPEKNQRLLSSLSTKSNNQINLYDCSLEKVEDSELKTQHCTQHILSGEHIGSLKEKSNDDDNNKANNNNNNNNNNAFHQRMQKDTIMSQDSRTIIVKTDKNEEKHPPHLNSRRISSGKNGVLCGLPKVLQRKSQDLHSQRPSVPGYKLNTNRRPLQATGNNFETVDRLVRSESGVKSQQKRTLIKINVRIPQVIKDDIVSKDAFIRTPSNSRMEKPLTGKEKAPETGGDVGMKVMESCNEDNQNKPEFSDRFSNARSNRNSSIHTEGITDPFIFSDTHATIENENENGNNNDDTNNQKSSNDKNEDVNTDDITAVTTTTTTNNNNNSNNYEEDQIQNNPPKTRKRATSASGCLVSGNDDVYHKGILLSNYISPEQRYKMTLKGPGLRPRLGARSHSLASSSVINSNSYVIRLNFSKQARQQALAKLVEDNHSARGNSIQKALTESLQARIKAFCVSLDPYRQSTCL